MKEKVRYFSLKVDYDRLSEFEWQLEYYSIRQMFKSSLLRIGIIVNYGFLAEYIF